MAKYDNYEMLTTTAKLLQGQDGADESLPFLIVASQDKDAHKTAVAVLGSGGAMMNMCNSVLKMATNSLKESDIPVGAAKAMWMKAVTLALMEAYGAEALPETLKILKCCVDELGEELDEEEE